MGGTTSDSIPYMTPTDPLSGLDEHSIQLATRLQALEDMKQGGATNITPSAANTPTTKRVDFPEAVTVSGTPKVVVCLGESAGPAQVALWVTAIDSTGFTLGINATTTATRAVKWLSLP